MEINGFSSPMPPMPSGPVDGESEGGGGGKAKGVVRKLNEGDHFSDVAEVRLRTVHFDNPDLEPLDPVFLRRPEDVPGGAYRGFYEEYQALYAASQAAAEPVVHEGGEGPVEPVPPVELAPPVEPEAPVEEPAPPVEPEAPVEEPTGPVELPPVMSPPVIDPLAILPEVPEVPEEPEGEGGGALEGFEEIIEQGLEEEVEPLDLLV